MGKIVVENLKKIIMSRKTKGRCILKTISTGRWFLILSQSAKGISDKEYHWFTSEHLCTSTINDYHLLIAVNPLSLFTIKFQLRNWNNEIFEWLHDHVAHNCSSPGTRLSTWFDTLERLCGFPTRRDQTYYPWHPFVKR